nr:hypothetical protein [Tanacetum cinerariifolium]
VVQENVAEDVANDAIPSPPSHAIPSPFQEQSSPPQQPQKIYHLDLDHPSKVLSMQEDDSEVQEVVEVVTTMKLITDVVTAASQVSAASVTISAA